MISVTYLLFSNYQQCRIFIGVNVISFGNWYMVVYFHSPIIFYRTWSHDKTYDAWCSLCAILIWYVPKLKCCHFNFRTYHIRMSHWPSCIICIIALFNPWQVFQPEKSSAWISLHWSLLMTSLTTPLTTRVIRMSQIFHPLTKNSFVRFPPYFTEGIIGMTFQNAENFMKIRRLVSDKFLETEIILFWAPFIGVQMLRFDFWVLKGTQQHKKFRVPRTSHFGDIREEIFNFPTSSPKMRYR